MNEKSFSKKKLIKEYLNFDWKSYINSYDDLLNITTKEDAWYHWINYGKLEGRFVNILINDKDIENFNWNTYIKNNVDLSYIKTKKEAWNHWIKYGKNENRLTNDFNNEDFIDFDWRQYVSNYDDLFYIKTKKDAWNHWIKYGKNENRLINGKNDKNSKNDKEDLLSNSEFINFDWKTYVNNYNDLLYIDSKEQAWCHWINYGKNENRICENIFLFDDYKNFDWKKYINNYDDLTYIDSEEDAWRHFVLYGFNEGRKLNDIKELQLNELKKIEEEENINEDLDFSTNKIYFKNKYTNCGKHFFGWKSSINYLLENYNFDNSNFSNKYYFDEWIEKLLVWGNKLQSEKYLKLIHDKNLQLITFLHGPPYEKYDFETTNKDLILNDELLLNKNIVNLIESNHLLYAITFLYVLSIDHKNYMIKTYPQFKNKLLSLYHPIDIHNCEKEDMFSIHKFMNKKKIYHIGWWLRNFTTFINFTLPKDYNKFILLKQEFTHQFNEKFSNIDKNIQIVHELQDSEYKKIFKDSCIFCDLTDAVANNVVLECIKYNTPIIVRRIPSIEEYLGSNYPLFFNDINDLKLLQDTNILHNKIMESTLYLEKMNKNPFMLDTFLNKITYDINKLKINENKYKLTWLYYLDNHDDDIEKYISIFKKQLNIENIKLIIINTIQDKIQLLEEYNSDNISIIHVNSGLSMNEIYNIFVNSSTTEYLIFKRFNNIYNEENYSDLCIDYLENNPTFDIIIFKNKLKRQYKENDNGVHYNDITYINNTLHDNNPVIHNGENSEVCYFIDNIGNDIVNQPNKTNSFDDFFSDSSDESSVFTDISDIEKIFTLDNDNTKDTNDIDSVSEVTELDKYTSINTNENLLTYSQVIDYNFDGENINILWRKSIHSYVPKFDEKFWLNCYINHLNIFEI